MGIKDLNKLLKQYSPSAITTANISQFNGNRVAIDSEILIHKFRTNDSKNSHIFGFINNVFWYLKNGIVPIYVFDGSPNSAKQTNVLIKRTNYREQLYQRVDELENKFVEQLDNLIEEELSQEINDTLDQLFKIKRKMSCMSVTKSHRNECKYLLKLMGVPFVVANEDAEALCVALQRKGIVDCVFTEDTDAITYFIASFLRDPINSDNPIKILRSYSPSLGEPYNKDKITVVNVETILREMDISCKSFIDMCILCGCDFCSTIPKIGPIKSYQYIKKYGSIENIIKETTGIIPDDYKYQEARDIFYKNHNQEIDKTLELEPLNIEDLKKYLFQERNLNHMVTSGIIDKYHYTIGIFRKSSNKSQFT